MILKPSYLLDILTFREHLPLTWFVLTDTITEPYERTAITASVSRYMQQVLSQFTIRLDISFLT